MPPSDMLGYQTSTWYTYTHASRRFIHINQKEGGREKGGRREGGNNKFTNLPVSVALSSVPSIVHCCKTELPQT